MELLIFIIKGDSASAGKSPFANSIKSLALLAASEISAPQLYCKEIKDTFSLDLEVIFFTSIAPERTVSKGLVICCSTSSAEAPG